MIVGSGIAVLILAYAIHLGKRTPRLGSGRLAWSDVSGWTPFIALLYVAGLTLVMGGALIAIGRAL